MENNHILGLYVAYYLARFNDEALRNLEYPTWTYAYRDIGEKLHVNKHSVNHWRDEFDPLFGHRVGWNQRPMAPSREQVSRQLEHRNEREIRQIVSKILTGEITESSEII